MPEQRTAARVVLMSREREVLLMQMDLPWIGRVWMVPGGGVEPGETLRGAARREVREETGATLESLGQELWWRDVRIEHAGRRIELREHYFLAEVERFEPTTGQLEPEERHWLLGYGWWSVDALASSAEQFAPPEIGSLLAGLVEEGSPGAPIRLERRVHAV